MTMIFVPEFLNGISFNRFALVHIEDLHLSSPGSGYHERMARRVPVSLCNETRRTALSFAYMSVLFAAAEQNHDLLFVFYTSCNESHSSAFVFHPGRVTNHSIWFAEPTVWPTRDFQSLFHKLLVLAVNSTGTMEFQCKSSIITCTWTGLNIALSRPLRPR